MKPERVTSVALAGFVCLAVYASAAGGAPVPRAVGAGAVAPAAGLAAAQDLSFEQFKNEVRRLAKIGDLRSLGQLVRNHELFMRDFVVFTAEGMGESPGPELAQDLKWIKTAWKEAYGTRFVSNMESYYQLMRPEVRPAHRALKARYDEVQRLVTEAKAKSPSAARTRELKALADEGLKVASGFGEIGDHYYAGEMNLIVGTAVNQDALGEDEADLPVVLEAYTAFIAHRDAIDLQGPAYGVVKQDIEYYKSLGASLDPETAAGLEVGPALPVATTFEAHEDITKIERPNYWTDEDVLTWQPIPLEAVGSTVRMANVDGGPTIERTAFEVVTVRPMEGEPIEVSMSGRPTLIETTLGKGAETRPWAFIMRSATNPEYMFGIAMNFSPTSEFMTIYAVPAAAAVFAIDGTEVRVFDDNLDGKYGSEPLLYSRYGMREKEYEAVVDSIVVGRDKKARPWSTLVEVDGQWYQLESVAGGRTIEVAPASLQTGTVTLSAKGIDFSSLLIKGTAALEGVVFDVADAKRGMAVPAGKYEILGGTVRDGGRTVVKAAVTPPRMGGNIYVKPGEEFVLELGAPFGFDFTAERDGDQITVTGESVVVVGVGGERYHRLWNARAQPEIKLRKAGSGKGGRGTRMQLMGDAQSITDLGQEQAWKPLDQSVENRYDDEVEVQLYEKKHDLFGKIESDWKAPRD